MNYAVKLTEEYIQDIYEQQVLHKYSVGTSRGRSLRLQKYKRDASELQKFLLR